MAEQLGPCHSRVSASFTVMRRRILPTSNLDIYHISACLYAPHRGLFLRVHESLCPFLFHPFLCAPPSQASRLEQVALVTRNKRKGIRSLDRFAADLDHDRESDRASAATLSSLCGVLLRWRRLDALDETGWSLHALSALPARRTAVCQRRIQ